jgi:hypothetical protein
VQNLQTLRPEFFADVGLLLEQVSPALALVAIGAAWHHVDVLGSAAAGRHRDDAACAGGPPAGGHTVSRGDAAATVGATRIAELSTAERDRAYFAVIEAAGRDNAQVTVKAARLRIAGKVGILIAAALAAHEVIKAKDKVTEFAKQRTTMEGGVLGGFVAGLGVSSVCGPAAPVCAIAVLLIGSTAGSIATEMAFDAYEHEFREFQAWRMR